MLKYKYKYNGKEWQDELGLNITAMDFRMYDNAIGRFHSIDKMTDIMPSLSPYRFAFNNPVLWKDPTGMLEDKGDPTPYIPLKAVTVTGKAKSKQPASFNYSLIPRSAMNDSRRPTMAQYNKANNTNYSSFKDYYNHEHYQPALKKQTKSIHDATGSAAKVCAVVATTLTGTAYLAPMLIAASPAIQSSVATLATNPTLQTSMFSGLSSYAGVNMLSNGIGQSVASIIDGNGLDNVNPVEIATSGFGGVIPNIIGSSVNTSNNNLRSGTVINSFNTSANNFMFNSLGGFLKNNLQLPNSIMTNASFATYQGMINTSVDAVSTGVSNEINK